MMTVESVDQPLRFSRGEYWVLSAVAPQVMPVSCLGVDEEAHFNTESHGLTVLELADTLFSLERAGLVYLALAGARIDIDGPEAIVKMITGPYPKLTDPSPSCGLTPVGGNQWEAFAKPRWDRYVAREMEDPPGVFVIRSLKRRLLYYYCRLLETAAPCRRLTNIDMAEPIRCGPWPVTYWKEFPEGFESTVRFDRGKGMEGSDAAERANDELMRINKDLVIWPNLW